MNDENTHIVQRGLEQRRFFGRRKVKPLSPLQQSLYVQAQQDLFFNHTDLEKIIDHNTTTILEIGFGGGEHLIHQAKTYPSTQYLGIDSFVNGASKLIRSVYTHDLKNIHLSDGDGLHLLQHIPHKSLDGIYLLYPDPWPKIRQRHRRFIQQDTALLIQKTLKSGGFFCFASDIHEYVEWVIAIISNVTDLYIDINHDPNVPFHNWIPTRYEQKAIREKRSPAYYQFIKPKE